MSKQTAIQQVAEMCAALCDDKPKDNLEIARPIVETVERNLAQTPVGQGDSWWCKEKNCGFPNHADEEECQRCGSPRR